MPSHTLQEQIKNLQKRLSVMKKKNKGKNGKKSSKSPNEGRGVAKSGIKRRGAPKQAIGINTNKSKPSPQMMREAMKAQTGGDGSAKSGGGRLGVPKKSQEADILIGNAAVNVPRGNGKVRKQPKKSNKQAKKNGNNRPSNKANKPKRKVSAATLAALARGRAKRKANLAGRKKNNPRD